MNWFELIRATLEQQHPALPWLVLWLGVFAACWSIRRWAPRVWVVLAQWGPPGSTIGHVTQAIPSAVVGAFIAAIGTGLDPLMAVQGALVALGAPLLHHGLKTWQAVRYRGALGERVDGPSSRRELAAVLRGPTDAG